MSQIKIGRNNPCPCGSGEKYKKCCDGKVPWNSILKSGGNNYIRYLSTRGKNFLFYESIVDALQLDRIENLNISIIKNSCTPDAVRKIYQAVIDFWPDEEDLLRILKQERNNSSGLYVGHYEPDIILQGVTRHSLYSDIILLVDPFVDPRIVKPEFNPIENPDRYIETTFKNFRLWFMLMPWVYAGIIKFIKTPEDFDLKLRIGCMKVQEERIKKYPELNDYLDQIEIPKQSENEFKEYHLISHPDEVIIDIFKENYPMASKVEMSKLLNYVHKKRDEHPYYVPFIGKDKKQTRNPIHVITSGANYEMAKITASLTNSHLITDVLFRWKEMEIDRRELGKKPSHWDSFSKAFHNIDFKFLNNIPLEYAYKLRQKNHLYNLRSFLSRIWHQTASGKPLADENIEHLKNELLYHINEAEDEWSKIDRSIIKWMGIESAAVTTAIASGQVDLFSAGLGISIGGLSGLAVAWHKRLKFNFRYPAGFLLKLKND